jgi:hypothetical protein
MVWTLATQFNVSNTIADQWFLYDHIFAKRWLIIHIESNDIPETWESVGYAIPAYLFNNDGLPGIDDSWVIGGDDRDNRYRLLPLKAQELIAPFEQGQAYKLYFRFVRYMRNATVSIYENDQEPSYGNGGTGVVDWADIRGDKDYNDLVNTPVFTWDLDHVIAENTWTQNSNVTVTHGLVDDNSQPIKPELIRVSIECAVANNGYSVGDELIPQSYFAGSHHGMTIKWDSLQIAVGIGGVGIPTKTGATPSTNINTAQWKLRIRATSFGFLG